MIKHLVDSFVSKKVIFKFKEMFTLSNIMIKTREYIL